MTQKQCVSCGEPLRPTYVLPRRGLSWFACPVCDSIYGYNEDGELKTLWERRISGRNGTRIQDVPEGVLVVIDE